jgi:hypothetical protein
LTVLLVVAVGGFLFAFQQRATAQRERDTAISNQIIDQNERNIAQNERDIAILNQLTAQLSTCAPP